MTQHLHFITELPGKLQHQIIKLQFCKCRNIMSYLREGKNSYEKLKENTSKKWNIKITDTL